MDADALRTCREFRVKPEAIASATPQKPDIKTVNMSDAAEEQRQSIGGAML